MRTFALLSKTFTHIRPMGRYHMSPSPVELKLCTPALRQLTSHTGLITSNFQRPFISIGVFLLKTISINVQIHCRISPTCSVNLSYTHVTMVQLQTLLVVFPRIAEVTKPLPNLGSSPSGASIMEAIRPSLWVRLCQRQSSTGRSFERGILNLTIKNH